MDDQPHGSTISPLPEDNDTPFSPTHKPSKRDDTHPATDTNVEPEEVYEEGLTGAAEIEEPDHGNAVVDFDPITERSDDIDKEQP
jgi:hypothetical protein